MKLNSIKQFEGECCPTNLVKGLNQQQYQRLHCIICYQVITKPVTLSCNSGHTFGMACIKQWIKDKNSILCPYCRGPAHNWTTSQKIQNQLYSLDSKCVYCNQWEGKLIKLQHHKDNCLGYHAYLQIQLNKTVEQQIKQLNIQINPHLKSHHTKIYQKYVQDWVWLNSDLRNWKWWWWCNNPWWENKSCLKCNQLWLKYQKKIDLLEAKRINIIQLINNKFIQVSLKDIFQQQN